MAYTADCPKCEQIIVVGQCENCSSKTLFKKGDPPKIGCLKCDESFSSYTHECGTRVDVKDFSSFFRRIIAIPATLALGVIVFGLVASFIGSLVEKNIGSTLTGILFNLIMLGFPALIGFFLTKQALAHRKAVNEWKAELNH